MISEKFDFFVWQLYSRDQNIQFTRCDRNKKRVDLINSYHIYSKHSADVCKFFFHIVYIFHANLFRRKTKINTKQNTCIFIFFINKYDSVMYTMHAFDSRAILCCLNNDSMDFIYENGEIYFWLQWNLAEMLLQQLRSINEEIKMTGKIV